MARNVTALGGAHEDRSQIPFTLVLLEIPSNTLALCNLDVSLYLDPATDAVDVVPGGARVEFVPTAELEVPELEESEDSILSEITVSVSNLPESGSENGPWYGVVAANNYQEAPVTVWRGNLSLAAGDNPDLVAATGAVLVFAGRIETVEADHKRAVIRAAPHAVDHTVSLPRKRYTLEEFPFCPKPGHVIFFGVTSEEL